MTTIILPTCIKCGCHDIRYEMWVGYKCFKCGYIFPKEKLPLGYHEQEKKISMNEFEYKVSEKTYG